MNVSQPPRPSYRTPDQFTLADLEAIRLLLRGGSIIDWHRLNFGSREEVEAFVVAQELRLDERADVARIAAVRNSAVGYLRRNFEFPIPKPVANLELVDLILLASAKGHRQLCACIILKLMHVIHHVEARELLFMLPTADEEVFHLVEEKVYRVIGGMLAQGFPVVEFIGGRKNRDSLYTKLLSKSEVTAAQIYDKLRFRIVTRDREDVFPILNHLMSHVFPFNYAIPGESSNTLIPFRRYCEKSEHLKTMIPKLQLKPELEEVDFPPDNVFSAPNYRVCHFVVDMPVRLPDEMLADAPPAAWALGRVIFVQTEFQIIDKASDQGNEVGPASHDAYKQRQKLAVMRRLKVGDPNERNRPRKITKKS